MNMLSYTVVLTVVPLVFVLHTHTHTPQPETIKIADYYNLSGSLEHEEVPRGCALWGTYHWMANCRF